MKRVVSLAAFAFFVAAQPSSAEGAFTGNELWSSCRQSDSDHTAVCFGYISGVLESLIAMEALADLPACVPPTATYEQTRDVVVEWLRANPAKRHDPAVLLTMQAIWTSYGCRYDGVFREDQRSSQPPPLW